jgi:hypothetical protein
MKNKIYAFAELVKFHGAILLRGFCRVLFATLTAGLAVLAAVGFACVTIDAGYSAVFDFIASCATAWLALFCMYRIGLKKRGGKK